MDLQEEIKSLKEQSPPPKLNSNVDILTFLKQACYFSLNTFQGELLYFESLRSDFNNVAVWSMNLVQTFRRCQTEPQIIQQKFILIHLLSVCVCLCLQGSMCKDFMVTLCCPYCATCQLKRDIDRRKEQGIF